MLIRKYNWIIDRKKLIKTIAVIIEYRAHAGKPRIASDLSKNHHGTVKTNVVKTIMKAFALYTLLMNCYVGI